MTCDRYGLLLYCEGMEEITIGLVLCVCKEIGVQVDWQGDIRQMVDACAGAVFAWFEEDREDNRDVRKYYPHGRHDHCGTGKHLREHRH